MRLKTTAIKTSFSIKRAPLTPERFYLIVFFVYAFYAVINRSLLSMNLISHMVKGVTIVSMGAMFVALNHKKLKPLLLSLGILLIYAVVAIKNDSLTLLCSSLLIVCASVTDFRKICKVSLIASFLGTILVIACAMAGLIQNRVYDHDGIKGQALGFFFYSTYPYILLFDMIMYMYLKKTISWIELACFAVLNMLIYHYSSLRLAFFLSFVLLFLYVVMIKFDFLHFDLKKVKLLGGLAFPGVFALMIWVVNTKDFYHGLWSKVDALFNGRLALSKTAFKRYSVPLLGQEIDMQGVQYRKYSYTEYFFIDSGYVYALLGYGIIFTCVLLLLHGMLLYRTCESNQKRLFIWLVAVLIFNIVNNVFVSLDFNPILCLVFAKGEFADSRAKHKLHPWLEKMISG